MLSLEDRYFLHKLARNSHFMDRDKLNSIVNRIETNWGELAKLQSETDREKYDLKKQWDVMTNNFANALETITKLEKQLKLKHNGRLEKIALTLIPSVVQSFQEQWGEVPASIDIIKDSIQMAKIFIREIDNDNSK